MPPQNTHIPPAGRAKTQQTRVEGDIKIRMIILIIVGILLVVMLAGGIAGLILNPSVFDGYWNKVLPIISGALFGFVGFIVGQKVGPDN